MLTASSSPSAGWHLPLCSIPDTNGEALGLYAARGMFRSRAHPAKGKATAGKVTHTGSREKTNGLRNLVVMGNGGGGRFRERGPLPFSGNWLVK